MAITRQQLATSAYRELGISVDFDVTPDDLTAAFSALNRMMASKPAWRRLGYSPGTGANDDTKLPDTAHDAVALNLAVRLAPGIGKVPHPDLKRDARMAFLGLLTQQVQLIPVQLPAEMPAGAGNRRFSHRAFLVPPSEPADNGAGGTIDEVDFE